CALEMGLEQRRAATLAAHLKHASVEDQGIAVKLVGNLEIIHVAHFQDEELLAFFLGGRVSHSNDTRRARPRKPHTSSTTGTASANTTATAGLEPSACAGA